MIYKSFTRHVHIHKFANLSEKKPICFFFLTNKTNMSEEIELKSALIDVTGFTTNELKRWIIALYVRANGKNVGGIFVDVSTIGAKRMVDEIFEASTKNGGHVSFNNIAGRYLEIKFHTSDNLIDCRRYDEINEYGLAYDVTKKFRIDIGKN